MNRACEYQGYYLDCDDEFGEQDVLKCKLFTNEGIWDEYCYCDEKERDDCMLYKYSKFIEAKDKEIERLQNRINKALELIYANAYDTERKECIDDLWGYVEELVDILKGSDKE